MSKVEAGDIIKLVNLAGSIFASAKAGYDEAKALAAKAGVSKEDLDAADARYAKVYDDPLAKAPTQPDRPFKLETLLYTEPEHGLLFEDEELWRKGEENVWMVRQKGVGIGQMPPPWFKVN